MHYRAVPVTLNECIETLVVFAPRSTADLGAWHLRLAHTDETPPSIARDLMANKVDERMIGDSPCAEIHRQVHKVVTVSESIGVQQLHEQITIVHAGEPLELQSGVFMFW